MNQASNPLGSQSRSSPQGKGLQSRSTVIARLLELFEQKNQGGGAWKILIFVELVLLLSVGCLWLKGKLCKAQNIQIREPYESAFLSST